MKNNDKKFMEFALKLAKRSDPYPNPRVGAVLVKNGKIIGQGHHKKVGMPHAEIEAINDAKRRFGNGSVKNSVLYTTQEPCSHSLKRTPPCAEAIIQNKISKVIFATKDPNPLVDARKTLSKYNIQVVGPTDQKQLEKINSNYVSRLKKKPFCIIKMAMSADGKTATRTGDSKWISSEKSLFEVHKLRDQVDAIMVGAGTVISDNPRLRTKIKNGKNPYRIIVDGKLTIPINSKVLKYNDGKTIIFSTEKANKAKIKKISKNKKAHIIVCGKKEVDLVKLMKILSAIGITSVMIEGGSELNAKAIEAKIVDRLILFIAPKIIGGKDAKPVIGGLGITKMMDAINLSKMKCRKIGSDLMVQFDIKK